jgi:hypothetical protein
MKPSSHCAIDGGGRSLDWPVLETRAGAGGTRLGPARGASGFGRGDEVPAFTSLFAVAVRHLSQLVRSATGEANHDGSAGTVGKGHAASASHQDDDGAGCQARSQDPHEEP